MTTDGRRVLSDEMITRALALRSPDQAPADLLGQVMRATSRTTQTTNRSMPWRRVALRRAASLLVAVLLLLALALWVAGQQQQTAALSGGLAYIRDGDVYLADADGMGVVKLLDDQAVDFTRVTLLDGDRLAVEGPGVISVIDPATGVHHRGGITGDVTTWLPGGHEYGYVRRTDSGTLVTVLVDLDTGGSRELPGVVPAGERSWSPDGRWLMSAPDDGSVVIIDTATGFSKAIVPARSDMPDEIHDVAWSPDSSRVAFVAQLPGVCDASSAVTPTAGATSAPFACQAGQTAVLVASLEGAPQIGAAEPITGDISDAPNDYKVGPGMLVTWSPDGEWIAYRARSGLSIVRPDGSDGRVLVASPVGWFSWATDSTGLDFVAAKSPDDVTGELSWIGLTDAKPRSLGIDGVGQIAVTGTPTASNGVTRPAPSFSATAIMTAGPAPDADPAGTWQGLAFSKIRRYLCQGLAA